MYEGKIIEYIDQGSFICALCLQDKGSKLHLLTQTNREINLAPKRALLVSQATFQAAKPREELLGLLRRTESSREGLKDKVDVRELWELLKDEQGSFDGKYLAELCFGDTVSDDHVSALFRSVFEDKLYFKMKDGRFLPNTEERIEQILKQREEEAAREELLAEGSKWLRRVLESRDGGDPACREEVIGLLIDFAVFGKDSGRFQECRELLSRAEVSDAGEVRKILETIGVWSEDENLDLIRYEISTRFDQEVLLASGEAACTPLDDEGREDLRALDVFTIDGPLTQDFDDALSITPEEDGLHLGVHITDVAGVLAEGTLLDREAARRASSLYLPCMQVPMLPHDLSQGALSLRQDCDRAAISLLCRFDREGVLLEHRFTPSIIRVKERLDYDEVDARYAADERLSALHRLAQSLHHRRVEQGAMVLSLPEITVRLDADSRIILETLDQGSPSRMMVAESMILYNWQAARFCRENRVPILYRGQEGPSERLPEDLENYIYFVFRQRRKLSPLIIGTDPRPHSGLGLDVYTNLSSPIRRYADLVIQRQMRNTLLGRPLTYTAEDLEKIRLSLGAALKDLERVRRSRFRYWIQKYLRQYKGEVFPAIVLNEMKSKYRILLSDCQFMLEMKRQNGLDLHEGQHFRVRIVHSDPWNDVLKVEYAGPATS